MSDVKIRKNTCVRKCLGEIECFVQRPIEEFEIKHIAMAFDAIEKVSNILSCYIKEMPHVEKSKSTSEV